MNQKRNNKSFTLVETLVAAIIFVIFVTAISAAFITAQSSQKFLGNFLLTINNLSFAIERMSRELRMSNNFSLQNPSEISFRNAYGQNVVYRLANRSIERSDDGGNTFLPITGENIDVLDLKFIPKNSATGEQPRITISITFTSRGGKDSEKYKKTVQTTISSREPNS